MNPSSLNSYSPSEERLNVLTHGIGLLLSVVGAILLIHRASTQDAPGYMGSFLVFGLSLILLYAASTSYHAARHPIRRAR